jgi:hypothetical protein
MSLHLFRAPQPEVWELLSWSATYQTTENLRCSAVYRNRSTGAIKRANFIGKGWDTYLSTVLPQSPR